MLPFIKIFNFYLPTYGLLIFLGMTLSFTLFMLLNLKKSIDLYYLAILTITTIFVGVMGAKLLYVLQNWHFYITYFKEHSFSESVILLKSGGLVFYGGAISGFIYMFFMAKVFKLQLRTFIDSAAPCLSLAHTFGRLGCFSAGCCYGLPSEKFGVFFSDSLVAPQDIPLIPIQLYEATFLLILSIIMLILLRKLPQFGTVLLYGFSYSLWRFTIEFFRGDEIRKHYGPLSTSQWLSLFIVLACLITLIVLYKKNRNTVKINA